MLLNHLLEAYNPRMDWSLLISLLFIGLFAGYIDAIAGGGGLLVMPTILGLGLPPHVALGTNKLAGTMGVLGAARIFIRRGIVQPRLWLLMIVATLLGAALGVVLVQLLSVDFLEDFIPFAIIALAIYMLLAKPRVAAPTQVAHPPGKASKLLLGGSFGFYDGFFGPGTGAFWVVSVMQVYKLDLLHATGIAKVMNLTSNLSAVAIFMLFGSIDYFFGIAIGLAMITGAHFGAHSAVRFGAKFIRPIFLCVVVSMAVYLLLK
jgi:uncharacterized membrane protein YfcA